jgi:hypothetical protein
MRFLDGLPSGSCSQRPQRWVAAATQTVRFRRAAHFAQELKTIEFGFLLGHGGHQEKENGTLSI